MRPSTSTMPTDPTQRPYAYIIMDPQHEYGIALVQQLFQAHRLRPVVIYSSRQLYLARRAHYAELHQVPALATYFLDRTSLAAIANDVRARFQVQGLVPYFEESVLPMAALQDLLQVAWNGADVLRRFRDKSALKAHLRGVAPDLALGYFRAVQGVTEVYADFVPERFIIKPTDGAANRAIGFFGPETGREEVAAYFAANGPGIYALEEQFIGTEYAINGQMDAEGKAIIVNILAYERLAANGKPNLYHRTHHVRQTAPEFAALADYARTVMAASGLVRCPFHMEAIVTEAGPRLIEVGARLGGTRYAFMANDVHAGECDIFALAAHYYVSSAPYAGNLPSWAHYNQVSYVHLDGHWPRRERIYSLAGVDAVEALPEFAGWVVKPRLGAMLQRTQDLYSVPYSFHLMSRASRAELVEVSELAKSLLRINAAPAPRLRRLWLEALALANRLALRLQLQAGRAYSALPCLK